jgi:hypothetical protein
MLLCLPPATHACYHAHTHIIPYSKDEEQHIVVVLSACLPPGIAGRFRFTTFQLEAYNTASGGNDMVPGTGGKRYWTRDTVDQRYTYGNTATRGLHQHLTIFTSGVNERGFHEYVGSGTGDMRSMMQGVFTVPRGMASLGATAIVDHYLNNGAVAVPPSIEVQSDLSWSVEGDTER